MSPQHLPSCLSVVTYQCTRPRRVSPIPTRPRISSHENRPPNLDLGMGRGFWQLCGDQAFSILGLNGRWRVRFSQRTICRTPEGPGPRRFDAKRLANNQWPSPCPSVVRLWKDADTGGSHRRRSNRRLGSLPSLKVPEHFFTSLRTPCGLLKRNYLS